MKPFAQRNALEEDDEVSEVSNFEYTRITPVHHRSFYLYTDIGPPAQYIKMINTIRTAEAHDEITIYINNGGGRLDTGIALISAFAETRATITTVLDSSACSMSAIIFLAGHQYIVHDCSMLMFHTFSGGFVGKGNDIDKQIKAQKRQYNMLMKKICSKFLTTVEFARIDNGEELWFTSDIVAKRLKNYSRTQQTESKSSNTK